MSNWSLTARVLFLIWHIINYLKGFMVFFKSKNILLIVWIYPLVQWYTPCFIALCWNFTKVLSFTILIHYHRIPTITIPWFNLWLFWTANGTLLLRHLLSRYWCSGLVWLRKTQAGKNGMIFNTSFTLRARWFSQRKVMIGMQRPTRPDPLGWPENPLT